MTRPEAFRILRRILLYLRDCHSIYPLDAAVGAELFALLPELGGVWVQMKTLGAQKPKTILLLACDIERLEAILATEARA